MNHLLVEAILPSLQSHQLDFLSAFNVETNKYIERNRLVLPRTKFDSLLIECGYSEDTFYLKICDNDCSEDVYKQYLMEVLKPIQIRNLSIEVDGVCEVLDELWIKNIEFITIRHLKNGESVEKFLKKASCTKLSLTNNHFELNGGKILDAMPSVEFLELEMANLNQEFFKKLIEKSKIGNGIDVLDLKDLSQQPLNAEVFIDFLKNAKFKFGLDEAERNTITISTTFEDDMTIDFQIKLMELNEVENWEVKNVGEQQYVDEYLIKTPIFEINFVIRY